MFHRLLLISLLFPFLTNGQQTIKGKFSPVEEFDWVLVYKVSPLHSSYIGDAKINEQGSFEFVLDSAQTAGMYRLVYAVPQEEYNFDVIYNAKEDIEFTFNIETGVDYQESVENKLVSSYTNSMALISQSIGNFYNQRSTDSTALETIFKTQRETQAEYEHIAEGTIASHFIVANRAYVPDGFENVNDYIQNIRNYFFEHVDFNNEILQSSNFLIERTLNFVFGMISEGENEIEVYKNNISVVTEAMSAATIETKKKLLYILWQQLAETNYEEAANYISNEFLLPIAKEMNDAELTNELVSYRNVSFGKTAPDFDIEMLKDNKIVTEKLSTLDNADSYILVFWSSTCSHCLEELPQLHEFIKTFEKDKAQVIAFGIEDEEYRWKGETYDYPDFIHVLGLGKWENEVGNKYNVSATPTYFILDKDKKIISKPNDIIELKKYFSDQK